MAKTTSKKETPGATEKKPTYSRADKKNIKLLEDAGITLDGTESGADLEQMVEDKGLAAGASEDSGPEVIPGVPNSADPHYLVEKINGKDVRYPIWHMAPVKGGFVVYDHVGRRVSPLLVPGQPLHGSDEGDPKAVDQVAYHRKLVARANSMRRANRLPNDPA